LEFLTLLRAGLDPDAPLYSLDEAVTAAQLLKVDSDYTKVAWDLALDLYNWKWDEYDDAVRGMTDDFAASELTSDRDLEDSDDLGDLSNDRHGSEHDDEDGNKAGHVSAQKVDEKDVSPKVPGAWINEDVEELELPIRRKFRSKVSDFKGSYCGFFWPRDIFLNEEILHTDYDRLQSLIRPRL